MSFAHILLSGSNYKMKFKLTSSQMNFYNKNFTLDSQIWNQGVMEIFPKVHSYDKINTAYNKLVESHDSLRVKLVETEDGVMADVREHEFINYRFWQVETEEELMKKAQDFLNEPIDRYGLLVNCAIFNTPTTSGFMINAHHIVVDGFSVIVMAEHMNELIKDINFVPAIQEYPDYIEAEEKYKKSRRFDKAKDFWLKEFSNKPECDIFTVKGNVLDFYSEEANSVISEDLFDKVNNFCQENEISVTSFFNTIYAVYFSRMYELSSFTMGVPVLNRTTQSEFNTIGLYMHVLPMVCNVVENESFVYNAKQIEDSQMNLLRYQKFTQTDIKESLKETEYESNNLFSIATDYQSFTTKYEYEVQIKYANYLATPIEIHLQSFNEILHNFKIRYRTAYFNKQEVEIMLKSIVTLVENAVETPEKNIFELEMVSASEKAITLNEFNDTSVEYQKEKCIHQLFEEQVLKIPNKTAVIACDKTLTYDELNKLSNRIANGLITNGIKPNDIVAFSMSRNSLMIATMLGILVVLYIIFLYCAIFLGEVRKFYYVIPRWDDILHCISSLMTGLLGFLLVSILNSDEKVRINLSPIFVALFAFCFSLSIGAVWEIYEFLADHFLGFNMQKFMLEDGTVLVGHKAIVDTMMDFIVDCFGALIASTIGYVSLKIKKGWVHSLLRFKKVK